MTAFETYRAAFAALVPELVRLASGHFRRFLAAEASAEATQNTIALAWQSYHSLIEQGRAGDHSIIRSIIWYSIRQTFTGRSLARSGNTNAKDAATAARAGKVRFERADLTQYVSDATPIPEAVAFRIDIPEFLATLTERQREMAELLMAGGRTQDVAEEFGVTPGAVSQFRGRFKDLLGAYLAD